MKAPTTLDEFYRARLLGSCTFSPEGESRASRARVEIWVRSVRDLAALDGARILRPRRASRARVEHWAGSYVVPFTRSEGAPVVGVLSTSL